MKRFQKALLVLLATACSSLFGQVATSSISGTVTDNTGATVMGATVTAVQTETNFTRTVQTDKQGQYQLLSLPLGPYRLDVNASGFKKFEQSGVVLDIDRNARVDAVLEVGAITQ